MNAVAEQRTPLRRAARFVGDRWYLRALLGAALISILVALAVSYVDATGSNSDQRVAVSFLINLTAVVGLQVFMGNSAIPSFGHVAFVAIGAYTAAIFMTPVALKETVTLIPDAPSFIRDTELGFVPGLGLALVVAALIAIPTGLAIVRLKGGAAAIATLAVLIIVQNVIGNWKAVTHGPQTWAGVTEHTTLGVALLVAVAAIFIARAFRESGIGLMLRATRNEELASSAVGVDIARARLTAWLLSAVIASAAGVLWATYFLAISPRDFFFDLTFLYVVMVILGGTSVSGAVVGTALVTLISEVTRRTETGGVHLLGIEVDQLFGLTPLVLGALVFLAVVVRPSGILGQWELDEWLARGARRVGERRANPSAGNPRPPGVAAGRQPTTEGS